MFCNAFLDDCRKRHSLGSSCYHQFICSQHVNLHSLTSLYIYYSSDINRITKTAVDNFRGSCKIISWQYLNPFFSLHGLYGVLKIEFLVICSFQTTLYWSLTCQVPLWKKFGKFEFGYYILLQFGFSKNATKIWQNLQVDLTFTTWISNQLS